MLLIGIVALFALAQLSWYAVERSYLSRGERNAAREALSEPDRLQAADSSSDDVFAADSRTAEVKIRNAERVEWTDRDIGVNFLLSEYLDAIRIEKTLGKKHQGDEWQARLRQSMTKNRNALHELLD